MDKRNVRHASDNQKSESSLEYENLKKQIDQLEQELLMTQSQLNHVMTSRTYQVSCQIERLIEKIIPQGSMRYNITKSVWRMLKKLSGKQIGKQILTTSQRDSLRQLGKYERMDVVTTRHAMYIARLIKRSLSELQIECHIDVGEPEKYDNIPYIIICPQFVHRFPKVYYVYQMEQAASSEWLTEEYKQKLRGACGVLDYSLINIEYFGKPEYRDIPIYYLPVDYFPAYEQKGEQPEPQYDVVFYGDAGDPRRSRILNAVSERFSVKICSDLHGEDAYREIRKARIILNIHRCEDALLETTRLYEMLSLNHAVIVSEDSIDAAEREQFEPYVDFVPIGDIDELLERVGYWVEHEDERYKKVISNIRELENRKSAFEFYFYRFLLAYDRIDFKAFYQLAGQYVQIPTDRICLNLPESVQRRKSFDKDNQYGFMCVPGLRHQNGWIGCGLSYKLIFTRAQELGLDYIMVCEDDVVFPNDFEKQLTDAMQYLKNRERWSLFSGIMADVGNVKIKNCEKHGNIVYAEIDRMMSMVFNIYHRDMFSLLSEWDEANRDEAGNTIDRYLEENKLSVHVQVPFMVGHKEELNSTIWKWSNLRYKQMIENSEGKLKKMIDAYLRKWGK